MQPLRYRAAVKVGRHNGRNYYRVPVRIRHNNSRLCRTVAERLVTVIAPSAAAAANWVRDNEPGVGTTAETEITAWGPKGGKAERYVGWDSAVWNAMAMRCPDWRYRQLPLSNPEG